MKQLTKQNIKEKAKTLTMTIAFSQLLLASHVAMANSSETINKDTNLATHSSSTVFEIIDDPCQDDGWVCDINGVCGNNYGC